MALLAFLLHAPSSAAQSDAAEKAASAIAPSDLALYRVGPGDVLALQVLQAPEFSGQYRVSESGDLEIASLPAAVHVDGQTTYELSQTIRQAFIDSKQLRNPSIRVSVEEFHGRTVTITGAVPHPGTYAVSSKENVLQALELAGGVLPTAGSTVTVVRGLASAEATGTAPGSAAMIDLNQLTKENDPAVNIEVRKGDIVSVPAADLIYVVGAVIKPGGFAISNPSTGLSVVEAIALAEGFTPVASQHHAVIVRQSMSENGRVEIPVDLAMMLSGKQTDVRLAPSDILYVPDSLGKKTLKELGDIATGSITGIVSYGVGYRIAQVH